MKKLFLLTLTFISIISNAQIGYQVSLLNSATGEPRANEMVEVTIELTNSEGTVIYTETKSETTNEFGILSLQVGSDKTFENMDWSKLPLYVSATVDGIMIGKSQILNVPVAEAAKTLVNVDPDLICKTWTGPAFMKTDDSKMKLTFRKDMTFSYVFLYADDNGNMVTADLREGKYEVVGKSIYLILNPTDMFYYGPTLLYYDEGSLYGQSQYILFKFK